MRERVQIEEEGGRVEERVCGRTRLKAGDDGGSEGEKVVVEFEGWLGVQGMLIYSNWSY